MTIPRRGSRKIVVAGTPYRWLVRRRPTYSQGLAWSPLTVAVEAATGGRTLVLVFGKPRPDNWVGEPGAIAKPADVAAGIAAARAAGWDSESSGGPVFYDLETGELRHSERDYGQVKESAPSRSRWEAYDPTWLVRLAEEQAGSDPWLANALASCTKARMTSYAMIRFVDPSGSDWDFDTNIILESESHGDLVLDALKGQRIGGVEFLSRL